MANVYLPKGMRDLLPQQMIHRRRVIATIGDVFTRYGFEPLETPAMERIETLMGKYGDEGDKLIFRVLKRGEGGKRGEVDQALRYDLTVPLARVIAMNPQLPLPFKRSQIQPVWRADRPQRGRFREFYQCDVDTVGAPVGLADAECIAVVHDCLVALGFERFTIRLNHRQWLAQLARQLRVEDQEIALIIAIDKLDKIGRDGVAAELLRRCFPADLPDRLWPLLDGQVLPGAAQADQELQTVYDLAVALGVQPDRLRIDRTLARGLDYYTGPVFETVLEGENMGSVSGGGRYDGLIGMFSGREIPAVGVTVGLERLFVLLEESGRFDDATTSTQVLVTVFDDSTQAHSVAAVTAFRAGGVPAEISLKKLKLGKQLKQADKRGVPFVVIIGPDEAAKGVVRLRDLRTGEGRDLPLDQAVATVAGS